MAGGPPAAVAARKAFTRHRDALSAARRALPWVKVEHEYRFQGPDGELSLADLFAGRSQLLVYHFMFAEGWSEGCHGCSFLADHFDGANLHLAHHDVSLVAVSRAPYAEFQAFRRRMGWQFPGIRHMAAASTRTLASASAARASGSTTMSHMRAMKASFPG